MRIEPHHFEGQLRIDELQVRIFGLSVGQHLFQRGSLVATLGYKPTVRHLDQIVSHNLFVVVPEIAEHQSTRLSAAESEDDCVPLILF